MSDQRSIHQNFSRAFQSSRSTPVPTDTAPTNTLKGNCYTTWSTKVTPRAGVALSNAGRGVNGAIVRANRWIRLCSTQPERVYVSDLDIGFRCSRRV